MGLNLNSLHLLIDNLGDLDISRIDLKETLTRLDAFLSEHVKRRRSQPKSNMVWCVVNDLLVDSIDELVRMAKNEAHKQCQTYGE